MLSIGVYLPSLMCVLYLASSRSSFALHCGCHVLLTAIIFSCIDSDAGSIPGFDSSSIELKKMSLARYMMYWNLSTVLAPYLSLVISRSHFERAVSGARVFICFVSLGVFKVA